MGSEGCLESDRKKTNVTPVMGRSGRSVSPIFRPQTATPTIDCENSTSATKEKGILLYALEDLFSYIKTSSSKTYCLACSYLEIYNEQVYDLLDFTNDALSVNEDTSRGFYVRGATEHLITSLDEILKYLETGETNRKYAATSMNHHSSRSHTIFRLNVTSVLMDPSSDSSSSITTESALNFVDLAGSERVSSLQDTSFDNKPRSSSRSRENIETLLSEGKYINTSLFYLCQVINKLSERTSGHTEAHIPYRNSNLTKILRSSLGGNSLTCIICTATPTLSQFEMTLSTLRFGGIAKTITNNVEANVKSSYNAELLQTYQKDLEQLRRELETVQQGGKVKVEEAVLAKKHLEERVARLTQMLFNQSRQSHITKNSEEETCAGGSDTYYCPLAGVLIVDKHLGVGVKHKKSSLKFDKKGALAFEKMKAMSADIRKKEKEIQELKECKESLIDSKSNLKNDLKQALNLCQQLSHEKEKNKLKCSKLKEKFQSLQERVDILESHKGLNKLNEGQLQELENFFFYSLDAVKNEKFRKKYEARLSQGKQNSALTESPEVARHRKTLWTALGICNNSPLSYSESDSSIDLESSAYPGRHRGRDCFNSFVSQDISTLIFENFENEEIGKNEIKQGLATESLGIPLSDISLGLLNSRKQ